MLKLTFLNIMMSFCYALYKADGVISNIILHLSVITLYKMVILLHWKNNNKKTKNKKLKTNNIIW